MMRVRRREILQGSIVWRGQSVALIGAEMWLWVGAGPVGFGARYHRPARIEVDGDARAQFPIKDFVMMARILALALPLAATVWRWTR